MVTSTNECPLDLRLLEPLCNPLECPIIRQNLPHLRCGIVSVARMINPATLNHQKEPLVAILGSVLQRPEGNLCHLLKTGIVLILTVDIERDIRGRKEAKQRQLDVVPFLECVKRLSVVDV